MVTWEDFEQINIQTGTIVDINDLPKAKEPAYQLKIDFGKPGIKQSSGQITKTSYQRATKWATGNCRSKFSSQTNSTFC